MNKDQGNEPAFPIAMTDEFRKASDRIGRDMTTRLIMGMTLRQWVAVTLRVPCSQTDWIDEAIREAQRDELAKALTAVVSVSSCYQYADRALAEKERGV